MCLTSKAGVTAGISGLRYSKNDIVNLDLVIPIVCSQERPGFGHEQS